MPSEPLSADLALPPERFQSSKPNSESPNKGPRMLGLKRSITALSLAVLNPRQEKLTAPR
jgi:hypothetical protein